MNRQKDRTSKTSVLTWEESWRFRRAAYRIILFCNLFPASRYGIEELYTLEEDGEVEGIQHLRTAVLSAYPTDELQDLYAVAQFMHDTFAVVASANDEPHDDETIDAVLGTGPDGLVRAWEQRSIDELEDELYNLFTEWGGMTLNNGLFTTPLAKIWAARGVETPVEGEPASKYILDTVVGADNTCSQCATQGGLKLLTETNWDRLSLQLSDLLKNQLKSSLVVTAPFVGLTEDLSKSDKQGPWIAEMFALKQSLGMRRPPAHGMVGNLMVPFGMDGHDCKMARKGPPKMWVSATIALKWPDTISDPASVRAGQERRG
ncbi:hypothetical protein C8R45DRAFT_936709 [Mycena sanguinolenta]|nr:hypothetical protein C8R45DRAFT_936709 [Mycena sanguinolenta]